MTSFKSNSIFSFVKIACKYLFMAIVAIYFIVWIVSPYVVRYFAKEPLQELGVYLVDNSSVRFNPFTSTLTASDISLLDKNQQDVLSVEALEVSVHLHRLILKQIYVSEFKVQNTRLNVLKTEDSIVVAGIDLLANAEEAVEEKPEPEISENEESNVPDFTVVIPSFNILDFSVLADIDGNKQNLTLDDFSLNDVVLNLVDQDVSLDIKAQINGAPLSLESVVTMESGAGVINSSVSITELDLNELSPLLSDFGVNLSGFLSLQANPKVVLKGNEINLISDEATLSIDTLLLDYAPWIVEGKSDQIKFSDISVITTSQGQLSEVSLNVSGEFIGGNVSLEMAENSLINWDSIDFSTVVNMVDMKPNILIPAINFESLNLSQDLSSESLNPLVSIKSIGIDEVTFAENLLSIDTIKVGGLLTDIKINPDKSVVSLVDTTSLGVSEAEVSTQNASEVVSPETDSDETAEPFGIVLNKFTIEDDAYIFVNDKSVSPAYDQKITIETLEVGPVNSLDVALQSPFELKAKDQSYLKIDASGFVSPFGETLNAALVSNVNELSLPSVSPYMKDALGFEMKSGQLDLNLDVKIADDQIDGDTSFFMRGIEMASADEVEQGTIKEGKAMPLNIALGMLKDDQDNIELSIPLRGDIADPSFGIESFFALVLKKAAMSQAKDYLMTTFVPYASVVSVALSGAEYLLKVNFEPLLFDTGEVVLTDEKQQYLSELVLFMKDKPELQLKTCAISNYQDLSIPMDTVITSELKSSIKALGDERQSNLKRYLIEQGIKSSRILYCAPELDTSDNAQPRIELKTD